MRERKENHWGRCAAWLNAQMIGEIVAASRRLASLPGWPVRCSYNDSAQDWTVNSHPFQDGIATCCMCTLRGTLGAFIFSNDELRQLLEDSSRIVSFRGRIYLHICFREIKGNCFVNCSFSFRFQSWELLFWFLLLTAFF